MALTSEYENVRDHIGRPAIPSERDEAPSIPLSGVEALFVRDALVAYCGYGKVSDRQLKIARGYVDYIEHRVYHEQGNLNTLYVHTDDARGVLETALLEYQTPYKEMAEKLHSAVSDGASHHS